VKTAETIIEELLSTVERHLAAIDDVNHVLIAYSGGVDSHVLLHVCAQLQNKLEKIHFQAIYIDHDLQDQSSAWAQHCEKTSLALGVNFLAEKVFAKDIDGSGPEQAARLARYGALARHVSEKTLLLTAQHQDDQAETLLLQLLRGAGVKGLSSMPVLSGFSLGYQLRPLLSSAQQDILQYAQVQGLKWIEDPSNLDTSYDRNFLRQNVIPMIKERWPAFSKTTARSAAHCGEASSLLEEFSTTLLMDEKPDRLSLSFLRTLDAKTQRLVIRQWLAKQQAKMPAGKVLCEIQRLIIDVSITSGCVEWGCWQLRLFNGYLFVTDNHLGDFPPMVWEGQELVLPEPLGMLSLTDADSGGIDKTLWESSNVTVSWREGGESIKLAGREGRKKLKKLLYENDIFPWVRQSIPLIYLNDKLAAVGDIWVDESCLAESGRRGVLIDWNRPDLSIK